MFNCKNEHLVKKQYSGLTCFPNSCLHSGGSWSCAMRQSAGPSSRAMQFISCVVNSYLEAGVLFFNPII
jgi:hypothetical protein